MVSDHLLAGFLVCGSGVDIGKRRCRRLLIAAQMPPWKEFDSPILIFATQQMHIQDTSDMQTKWTQQKLHSQRRRELTLYSFTTITDELCHQMDLILLNWFLILCFSLSRLRHSMTWYTNWTDTMLYTGPGRLMRLIALTPLKIIQFSIRSHRWKAKNLLYPKIREIFMSRNFPLYSKIIGINNRLSDLCKFELGLVRTNGTLSLVYQSVLIHY